MGTHLPADLTDLSRLEEVGDLHFEASAFSSALDYYQRILDAPARVMLELPHVLEIYRKSTDSALNLGDLALTEHLLNDAEIYIGARGDGDAELDRLLMAPLLGRQAALLTQRGAYRDALLVCKRAFAVLAVTDDHVEVANLQVTMGVCHHRLGRLDKAEEFYTDALATFRRIDDELGMAILYNNLALLQKNACRWDKALQYQGRSIALASEHGATHLLARLHLNEGIILRKSEHTGEARAALEKCLRLAGSLGDLDRQAKASLALGQLELLEGHSLRAEELILAGKNVAEEAGFLRESIIADEYMGDLLLARGEHEKALYNYGLGLDKARRIQKSTDLEGELLRRCAEAHLQSGDWATAVADAEAAIEICRECGELYELGFAHLTLAQALVEAGEDDRADDAFRVSIRTFSDQKLDRLAAAAALDSLQPTLERGGRSQLLRLKRQLNDFLESADTRPDDLMYCRLQAGLAEVLLRLGELDEALLTASEFERAIEAVDAPDLLADHGDLRVRIEKALVGDWPSSEVRLPVAPAVSLRDGEITEATLTGFLESCLARARADMGFVVLDPCAAPAGGGSRVVTRGLNPAVAHQAASWYTDTRVDEVPSPRLLSRTDLADDVLREVPGLASICSSCLFLPVAVPDSCYGVLCLGTRNGSDDDALALKPVLDHLAASAGFLAMSLAEEERNRPVSVDWDDDERPAAFARIITRDRGMRDMLTQVRKVSASELTVLLQGETGTGKGLLAHAIHRLSRRSDRKFLAVNCAAIPETLLESELFGHVKGSFTGAYADKAGLLTEAEGGTVFLDEIGKLPLNMQGKLLHFLDTKTVRPVGSNRTRAVDVRIVCATKSDLKGKVDRGEYLEDLYYRLLDFPVSVPPLRDRPDDVPLLATHFITRYVTEARIETPGCTSSFMEALSQHDWPGNVRELIKTINRAIVLAHGEPMLRVGHLPAEVSRSHPDCGAEGSITPLRDTMSAVEAREITRALQHSGGNKAEAARLLGISYPNLLKKVRVYGLEHS